MATLAHVHNTTGCSHDDVNPLSEGLCLLFEVGATVDRQNGEAGVPLKQFEFLSHLICQFTGRRQHQGLKRPRRLASLEDGQPEGCGLSGARASLSDDVRTLSCKRNGVPLHLRCELPAHGVEAVLKGLW